LHCHWSSGLVILYCSALLPKHPANHWDHCWRPDHDYPSIRQVSVSYWSFSSPRMNVFACHSQHQLSPSWNLPCINITAPPNAREMSDTPQLRRAERCIQRLGDSSPWRCFYPDQTWQFASRTTLAKAKSAAIGVVRYFIFCEPLYDNNIMSRLDRHPFWKNIWLTSGYLMDGVSCWAIFVLAPSLNF